MATQENREGKSQSVGKAEKIKFPTVFQKRTDGVGQEGKEKKPHDHNPAGGFIEEISRLFVQHPRIAKGKIVKKEEKISDDGMEQRENNKEVIRQGKRPEPITAQN